jgi:Skp family chaperone for outer membrane proteins
VECKVLVWLLWPGLGLILETAILKTSVIASLTFCLPILASAATYTDAVEKQSKCKAAGKLSQSFYGTTREHLQAEAKKVQVQEKLKKISKDLSSETVYLMYIGYKASSAHEAYMKGWAQCMDQK